MLRIAWRTTRVARLRFGAARLAYGALTRAWREDAVRLVASDIHLSAAQ